MTAPDVQVFQVSGGWLWSCEACGNIAAEKASSFLLADVLADRHLTHCVAFRRWMASS